MPNLRPFVTRSPILAHFSQRLFGLSRLRRHNEIVESDPDDEIRMMLLPHDDLQGDWQELRRAFLELGSHPSAL